MKTAGTSLACISVSIQNNLILVEQSKRILNRVTLTIDEPSIKRNWHLRGNLAAEPEMLLRK